MENPVIDVDATEGAAQSAIQYFENMRNFLVAVGDMKLLTFEASDLEKVFLFYYTFDDFIYLMYLLRCLCVNFRAQIVFVCSFLLL